MIPAAGRRSTILNLDRLDVHLQRIKYQHRKNNNDRQHRQATPPSPQRNSRINRVFDASRDLVYRAFTDLDQLAQWFGPVGFSVPRDTVDMDVRVGGHQRFVMVSDDNPDRQSPVDGYFPRSSRSTAGRDRRVPGYAHTPTADVDDHAAGVPRRPGGKTRLIITQGPYNEGRRADGQAGLGELVRQARTAAGPLNSTRSSTSEASSRYRPVSGVRHGRTATQP